MPIFLSLTFPQVLNGTNSNGLSWLGIKEVSCAGRAQPQGSVMKAWGRRAAGPTWIKEDDGFEAGVLILVDLQLLEGQHQLIQDAHGHPVHLCQLRAVPGDDVVVAWMDQEAEGWVSHAG